MNRLQIPKSPPKNCSRQSQCGGSLAADGWAAGAVGLDGGVGGPQVVGDDGGAGGEGDGDFVGRQAAEDSAVRPAFVDAGLAALAVGAGNAGGLDIGRGEFDGVGGGQGAVDDDGQFVGAADFGAGAGRRTEGGAGEEEEDENNGGELTKGLLHSWTPPVGRVINRKVAARLCGRLKRQSVGSHADR